MSREEITNEFIDEKTKEIASKITIRSYENGNSKDTTRESTEPEREIIHRFIYAMFLAYRWNVNSSVDSICDMAEFALHQFIPEANTYDTIYIPFKTAIGVW